MKIALTGKLRSGKSVAEQYLCAIHDFAPFAFASEGKALVHSLFPGLPKSPKPRKYYQEIIDGMTKFPVDGAEDVWINAEMRKIDAHIKRQCCKGYRVLVSDMRKQREYDRLKAEGFVIIRITAPEELRIKRAREAGDSFTEKDMYHVTEQELDSFECDFEMTNDGDIYKLYRKLDHVLHQLKITKEG